ncbi:hypothetical protein ETB97_003267 [Aspergillus alliaceus]|uniref:Uncharacterized protein n=1 Tax=Petromyces alliaceus TaxID=209559 RepID=A0A5N6FV89_PETAA|nr:uncharacterized protein BDW43DRAFT_310617 [Aspergillus alliaceus]KAB8233941.1 hypothetical protein BDW43DRAFT_310617 [Aspergillus alliaceus]KAE8391100.1 hypothetical protein BDV23DRAFT_153734 [Aspergillus alliaceus]KAF5859126.1 hypothetical protein ETB97_003267 [Aspergillus burnettii]
MSVSHLLSSALGAAHLVIGILSLGAPIWTTVTLYGVTPEKPVAMATRIGGSRDTLLGGWLLFFCDGDEQRRLSVLLSLINATDAVSAIICCSEGNMPLPIMKSTRAASVLLVALGTLAWCL